MQPIRTRTLTFSLLLGLGSVACSAGSGDESTAFLVGTTHVAVGANTPLVFSGRNLAFLASEATSGVGGTNFNVANGDADKTDSIAVVVDMVTGVETVLNVAAQELAWVGNELYLVVSEAADTKDWLGANGAVDLVLLHWSAANPTLTPIETLATAGTRHLAAIGTNVFYAAEAEPAGATLSNFKVIGSAAPLVATMIPTQDLVDDLAPRILAVDEGLIFLELDEAHQGRNLNGDADGVPNDARVLALLDGTDALGVIRNVGLALPAGTTPLRARKVAAHDWQVGFLVSEAAQGNTNLNSPALFDAAWHASQCVGSADLDTSDDVLHFLEFSAWNANPVTAPPRNTGLVGRDRIALAAGFIATISRESDDGDCDLNGDGDVAPNDDVVRWTQVVSAPAPILPLNTAANIHALFDVPGGTHGLAELSGAFVISVDEADDNRDIDGDTLKSKHILGWLVPANTAVAWDFTPGTANTFAGASWLGETAQRAYLGAAFEESVGGQSLNDHVPPIAGDDLDTLDSVFTFPHFSSANTLAYLGAAVAVDRDNAGITLTNQTFFYRVNEAEDGRDYDADTDKVDEILFRTSTVTGGAIPFAVLNDIARPAVEFDTQATPYGAAFIASEAMQGVAGTDLIGDTDTTDFVVRWFRFQ